MTEREIVGRRENDKGRITHVAVIHPVDEVWTDIETEKASYYTTKNGNRAGVYGRTSEIGNKFLTTNPDDTRENNLDFLTKV